MSVYKFNPIGVEITIRHTPTGFQYREVGVNNIWKPFKVGAGWSVGNGLPTGGEEGDFYIDLSTGNLYYNNGSWAVIGSVASNTIYQSYQVTRSYTDIEQEDIIPYDAIEQYPEYIEPTVVIFKAIFIRDDGVDVTNQIPYKKYDSNSIQVFPDLGYSFTGTITIELLRQPI